MKKNGSCNMEGYLFLNELKMLEWGKVLSKRVVGQASESWVTDSKLGCTWPVLSGRKT